MTQQLVLFQTVLKSLGPNRILQVKRAFNLSYKDFLGPSNNLASNLAKNFLEQFNSASTPTPTQPQYLFPLMLPGQFMPGMNFMTSMMVILQFICSLIEFWFNAKLHRSPSVKK